MVSSERSIEALISNFVWRGVRLKDVLAKAGVKPDAIEVWFGGADGPVMPATPAFRKYSRFRGLAHLHAVVFVGAITR